MRTNSFTMLLAIMVLAPAHARAEEPDPPEAPEAVDAVDAVEAEPEVIVVTGTAKARGLRDVYSPTTVLFGEELQRSLTSSVPATLETVPGFAVQYNGPGAASPTIRGMSGNRILLLEDGHRTGDLYASAGDHGVMVEPLSAKRIEIVRGPAALLYASNALGGVVNVIREDIPRSRPDELRGIATSQVESVNTGASGGGLLFGPLGPLAFQVEGVARRAGDTRTPLGTIDNTDLRAYNLAAGLSLVRDAGFAGASFRYYGNTYGVPGEFGGELVPGGHPGGVVIDARRMSGRVKAAYRRSVFEFFDSVELDGNVTRYLHDEIEGIAGGQQVLGARFDQVSVDSNLVAHHDHALHGHEGRHLSAEGGAGLSYQGRFLAASGASPGTRSGHEQALAGFVYEEIGRSPLRLQGGLRYDYRRLVPYRTDPIRVRTDEREIFKPVTARSFGAMSASLAALWDIATGFTLGTSLTRSLRTPTLEELYSDGPHLADFSFDIGSPDLGSERGLGADLFVRVNRPGLSVELAGYYNRVDNYIYYSPTGETVRVFRDGAPTRVAPVFESRGVDAHFLGAEGRVTWKVLGNLVLDGTASYTRAERRGDRDPLPFIPPLSGRAEVRYEANRFFASLGANLAAPQNRVPRPVQIGDISERPQEPTSGHSLLNAGAGWRHHGARYDHLVTLQARNLTDRVWRDHLSRIKDVAPQPGRNIQLTYRVNF